MRTLRFVVTEGQRLAKDPNCDFSGITIGTSGYLCAEFELPSEWEGCKVCAIFSRPPAYKKPVEYPVVLKDNKCLIPDSVLNEDRIMISLLGMKKDYKIKSSTVLIRQER